MSELVLAGIAISNLAMAMAATKLVAHESFDAATGRIVALVLLILAGASIIGSAAHAGWTVAISMVVVDVVLLGYVYRLAMNARRLQVAAAAIDNDATWQREEKQRALYDRCSGMF
jgi:hypothetical protein